jgi:long-subunit fatty acid transport protein
VEDTTIAFDIRRFGYESARLFGDPPAQGGLGWQDIWAFAIGFERKLTDMIDAEGGFSVNGNPIPDAVTLFNIQMPALNEYTVSGGASVALTERVDLVASVVYGFPHTNSGTILQIPGTAIDLRQDLWAFSLGFTFRL